jgi:hypothetical protein
MKTRGKGGTAPPFLTSALDEGEWSASRPGCFNPGEITPSTHWTGGWLDVVETNLEHFGFRTRAVQPVRLVMHFKLMSSLKAFTLMAHGGYQ